MRDVFVKKRTRCLPEEKEASVLLTCPSESPSGKITAFFPFSLGNFLPLSVLRRNVNAADGVPPL
jgi:hypothetical protein